MVYTRVQESLVLSGEIVAEAGASLCDEFFIIGGLQPIPGDPKRQRYGGHVNWMQEP